MANKNKKDEQFKKVMDYIKLYEFSIREDEFKKLNMQNYAFELVKKYKNRCL